MTPDADLTGERIDEVLRHAGAPADEQVARLLGDLWANVRGDALPAQLQLPAAEAMGAAAALGGEEAGRLVRRVLALGRALADHARTHDPPELTDAEAGRLQSLVDEAAARATAAWARAATERRESWLSFLNHEAKNPLNTILNALWLLREHRNAGNTDRFLDLAERAVKRMEGTLKDLRDLHRKAATPPPIKEGPSVKP
jgi:signal transduction histidine kinase